MYLVISAFLGSGIKPQQLVEAIHWKKKNLFIAFDGDLDEQQFIERLMENDTGGTIPLYKRYFSSQNELFHIDGMTYALSNQWGNRTLEAVELLQKQFPSVSLLVKATSD